MKRYLKLYGMFLSQYIKTLMQSKVDFFVGFIAFFFIQASGIAFLYLVFNQIPDLKGWSFEELLFIYGFAQIPRGLDHMFTDYIWILAGNVVVRGQFDRYLLRPLNPLFQLIAERFQADGIGEVIIGILLVIYSYNKLDLSFTFIKYILMVILIMAATVIYTSIKLFFASLAFWIKRSQSILYMFYMTADFSKYPIGIYHKIIRYFITFIIPFALTAYIPASYFLGVTSLQLALGLVIGMAIVLWLIAYNTFKRGTNIYESVGN